MDNLKFVVFCSVLIKAIVVVSVTFVAIEFENYHLLWWYLLAWCVGWEYNGKSKG